MRKSDLPGQPTWTRRDVLRRGGETALALGLAGPAAELLSACGGGGGASATATSAAVKAPTPSEIANASGTLKVLGWSYYQVPEFQTAKVKAKWGYLGTNEETITKARQAGTFDLTTITSQYEPQLRKAQRIEPIVPSLIPNLGNVDPVFRDSQTTRFDGKTWGIPLQWGYGYLEYNAAEVSKPQSLDDLMAPKLRKKIGMPDDPFAVITTFAILTHQPQPTQLTKDQFNAVLDALNNFKSQILTIHQYGEEPAILARGDILVDFPAYGPSFLTASKGGVQMKITLLGAFSYMDCWSAYEGANLPLAYAYMNQSLRPEAQLACVTKGAAFPVVSAAKSAVPGPLQYQSAAAVIKEAPLVPGPPADASGGKVPFSEWITAWEQFKTSV